MNLIDLSSAFTQYVVTPLNAFGVGGFVFDNEGEYTAELSTEITDHFLENNSFVQDHIAIKPKKLTLKSYVGELVFRQDDSTDTLLQNVTRKLTTLNAYLPALADQAQTLWDLRDDISLDSVIDQVSNMPFDELLNKSTDYWSMLKNMTSNTRQHQAYMYFKALLESRTPVSVQTPFEFMNRMAVESVRATQLDNEKYVSEFTITLKEIRVAKMINMMADNSSVQYVNSLDQDNSYQQNTLQGRATIQWESDDYSLGNLVGQTMSVEDISAQINVSPIGSPPQQLPTPPNLP